MYQLPFLNTTQPSSLENLGHPPSWVVFPLQQAQGSYPVPLEVDSSPTAVKQPNPTAIVHTLEYHTVSPVIVRVFSHLLSRKPPEQSQLKEMPSRPRREWRVH